jgi:hypothetical protein
MANHGMGYIPDSHDKSLDLTTRHLLGAMRAAPPQEASLEQHVAPAVVWDQRMTSACTGFAFARAVQVRCAAMNKPIARPSATGIYIVGRAVQAPGQPLLDVGADPESVKRGCMQWGVASDTEWPPGGFDAAYDAAAKKSEGTLADDSFINQMPDLAELEAAWQFRVLGSYRISSAGAQRELDVQQAISEGYPVAVGTVVDRALEDYAGGFNQDGTLAAVTAPNAQSSLGGHMTCLVGYKRDPRSPTRVLYRGVNSWGTSWGDGGLYWADSMFVQATEMGDIIAYSVAPTEAGIEAYKAQLSRGGVS